jgi:hypothetical protein
VDFTNQLRHDGYGLTEALVEAGKERLFRFHLDQSGIVQARGVISKLLMKYLIILLSVSFINLNVTAQLLYSLTFVDSSSGRVKVSIQVTNEKKVPMRYIMPRSVPGAYGILNYDAFIENISAITGKGEKIAMVKDSRGAPRWYLADTGKAIIRIEYDANLRDLQAS